VRTNPNSWLSHLGGSIVALLIAMPVYADGDAKKGEELSITHCARCHVIGPFNKFGGLGSTPSIPLIAGMEDGYERFEPFYDRRPHPVFVSVPGVERWSKDKTYITEFTVTEQTIEDLMAYVKTIKKLDLSKAPVLGGFGRRKP
jgi:mono/diheme cytochrome c family protein